MPDKVALICLQEEVHYNSAVCLCRYVIPALRRSDAGSYQCVVRNRMGALLQRRSEVQVACMFESFLWVKKTSIPVTPTSLKSY